jgi:hypothetical protein
MTSVFSNCQTTNAAKQLSTRVTSLGGLFEVFGTIGGAYMRNRQAPGYSELWNSMTKINSANSCTDQVMDFALTTSLLLSYEAPEQTFYD